MSLFIVSNRLPVAIEQESATWRVRPASGGLVSALAPVLQDMHGTWIGWPGAGCPDASRLALILNTYSQNVGYRLRPVPLAQSEVEGYYNGFCNEVVWPLFHDLQTQCDFVPDYWTQYLAVTQHFADVVQQHVQPGEFIWIQDYHLMGLGGQLRQRGLRNQIGFFLHIPFPSPDIFCKLPWREDVIRSILHYDIVGFQTPRDQDNFLDCATKLIPGIWRRSRSGIATCVWAEQTTQVGSFPIGIDFNKFARAAASLEVTQRVKELRALMPSTQIVLGLDRLDYTKGIPYRLRAFHLALTRHPELRRKVTLLQVVVPSREAVHEYQELKAQIERLVSQINGEFTEPGWVPIHHVFRTLEPSELVAYYRAADVALVTPLKDGMNLVAKEYCACQIEGDGVLVLSEFAGAAVQLGRDAILVNPYDIARVADAIHRGVTLSRQQRRPTMRRLRKTIRQEDVFWWADRFLRQASGLRVASPPTVVQESVPLAAPMLARA